MHPAAVENAWAWKLQLEQAVVLMDDLQSTLLPSGATSGVLPAVCLVTQRELYFSQLQKRLVGLALLALKGSAAQLDSQRGYDATAAGSAQEVLRLSLELLAKVLSTVAAVGTLPVCTHVFRLLLDALLQLPLALPACTVARTAAGALYSCDMLLTQSTC
jgi:hypothetical protein